jgi:hypothetical protein
MNQPAKWPEKKTSPLSVVVTSGLGIAVLGWIFQMQGRAYRTAELSFKGLDNVDFPLSAADLQWLTLIGWTEVSVRWFKNAWRLYVETLITPGLGVLAILLAAVWITKLWLRYGPSLTARIESRPSWLRVPSWPFLPWVIMRAKETFAVSLAVLAAVSAAPAALWIAAFFVLFSIVIAILPFESAGKQKAYEECSKGLSSLDLMHLSDDYSDIIAPRKLLCSELQCAVISDNNIFVIPRTAVTRIEVVFSESDDATDDREQPDSFCNAFKPKVAEAADGSSLPPSRQRR